MAVSHPTCAIEAGHGWAVGWVIAGYAAGISVSRVQVKHPTAPEAMRRPAWRFVAVKLEHFARGKSRPTFPCLAMRHGYYKRRRSHRDAFGWIW